MNKNFDKKLKLAIKSAYDLPDPKRKSEFLRETKTHDVCWFEFFLTQFHHIRKATWILEFLITAACITMIFFIKSSNLNMANITIISSAVPFLVLISVTEIFRSISYNMAELEMTTKYSLNQIVVVRLIILGTVNFVCLFLLSVLLSLKVQNSIFQLLLYVFTPFLITCFSSLYVMNYMRNKSANYCFAAISIFVSTCSAIFINIKYGLYSNIHLKFWIILFVVLSIGVILQIKKLIKNMEEYNWNLV